MVRCGRSGCRCASGKLHGPFYYIFWREGGRLRKRYVKQADLADVQAAVTAWRRLHPPAWQERQQLAELRRLLRELDTLET